MLVHTLAMQPPTFQWLRKVPSIKFGLETNTLRSLRDTRRTPFRERIARALSVTKHPPSSNSNSLVFVFERFVAGGFAPGSSFLGNADHS